MSPTSLSDRPKKRETGIDGIDAVPWGTHICLFYDTKQDLLDILVPYFKTGLEDNEFCIWVTSEPLSEKEAEEAMGEAVPDFAQYLEKGQMAFIPYTEFYFKDGVFNLQEVQNILGDKLNQALAKGYDGMRVTGNTAWVEKKDWRDFSAYEEEINKVIGKCHMLAICTYPLAKCGASELIDVMGSHPMALIRRAGDWVLIGSSEYRRLQHDLGERGKELECIYGVVNVVERPGITLDELYQEVANLLPQGWQYPETTCARIAISGKEFKTENYRETEWKQSSDISAHGAITGIVEIGYLETRPEIDEGPFLEEERLLISNVAEQLGDVTEREWAEEQIEKSEEKYRSLFENMLEGFAYCKILVDEYNQPVDFIHLEVNDAWERLIGLKKEDVIEKKVTEVIPCIKESKTDLISIYGRVALTGEETEFVLYFEPLGKWFRVSVYSPEKYYFIAVFENITEYKRLKESQAMTLKAAPRRQVTSLQQRFISSGSEGFSDQERIELLLSLVLPRREYTKLAKKCIEQFKNLRGFLAASPEELEEVGVAPRSRFYIKLLHELPAQALKEQIIELPGYKSSNDVFDYLSYSMLGLEKEVFKVIYLDSQNHIIDTEDLFEGAIDGIHVYPREIQEGAIKHKATALIFAHNHPSGDCTPSQNDRQITRDLVFIGKALQIRVVDHIIIGENKYYSFADAGLITRYEDNFLNLRLRKLVLRNGKIKSPPPRTTCQVFNSIPLA